MLGWTWLTQIGAKRIHASVQCDASSSMRVRERNDLFLHFLTGSMNAQCTSGKQHKGCFQSTANLKPNQRNLAHIRHGEDAVCRCGSLLAKRLDQVAASRDVVIAMPRVALCPNSLACEAAVFGIVQMNVGDLGPTEKLDDHAGSAHTLADRCVHDHVLVVVGAD